MALCNVKNNVAVYRLTKNVPAVKAVFDELLDFCVSKRLVWRVEDVCTINEANMGLQLAAIARRYMKQLLLPKKKKATDGNDGKAQVGINLKQMLANQKIAASENVQVFGCEKLHTFVSQRTPEGDLLIMRAHGC